MSADSPSLVIRYSGLKLRFALIVSAITAPVWIGWSFYVSSWLAKAIIVGGFREYTDLFCLLCFYVGLTIFGLFLLAVSLDNRIVLTQDGVRVPLCYLLEMNYGTSRQWDELQLVEFKDDELLLKFKDGFSKFSLNGLRAGDMKDLVIATRTNSPNTRCSFDKKAIATGIAGVKAGRDDKTFTSVWEENIAIRFGTTAFVPLETKTTLQNGRLTVVGQVSFGGLSAIYLCKDPLGETVILKEAVVPLNVDESTKQKAMELFQREATILQGLNNPSIARVLDHFVENGRDYIVLEHVDGLDLRQYIKELGPQPERLIMRWGLEAAHILTYLHTHNPPIIHRDVTPDNLVLDRTGSIKLIDFGAANLFLGTATGTLVGKQSYISPEQFRGKATPQSDIYSLGCTLFFLATGKDPDALSHSHLPDELSVKMPKLDSLIALCTALELEDRIENSERIAQNCQNYLTELAQEEA
jgi:tRNA A-37 threonylcarbamoyl transferase component Bud32